MRRFSIKMTFEFSSSCECSVSVFPKQDSVALYVCSHRFEHIAVCTGRQCMMFKTRHSKVRKVIEFPARECWCGMNFVAPFTQSRRPGHKSRHIYDTNRMILHPALNVICICGACMCACACVRVRVCVHVRVRVCVF